MNKEEHDESAAEDTDNPGDVCGVCGYDGGADGYNGTPAGFENVCEDEGGVTKPYVLHAEANAITKVARSNNSSEGSTLYVTASPCVECAKLIIQAGIRRVVFSELYRITDGVDLLRRAGVECVLIDDDKI